MAYRTFWTADGRQWEVWDVDTAAGSARLPQALPGGWLCFATEGEKRRLYPLPDAWDTCTDAELEALRNQAATVPPRRLREEMA